MSPIFSNEDVHGVVHKWLRDQPKTFFLKDYASLWFAGPSALKGRETHTLIEALLL
jgi:hypothetical protein